MNIKNFLIIFIGAAGIAGTANAQLKNDTVKIPLANTSQIIFTMKDRSDLETLKHYNFQELFMDLLAKIEHPDSVMSTAQIDTIPKKDDSRTEYSRDEEWRSESYRDRDGGKNDDDDNWEWKGQRRRWGRTWQSFNFDLGTNNFLAGGSFPDKNNEAYSVRPWGSWYIAFNSIQRTRMGRNFFLEWGGGISWYTFKFQNSNTVIQRNDTGIEFALDNRPERSYNKSKLGITYINASVVPVIDFGDRSRKTRIWSGGHSAFRIGLGPYVGYRISSLSKIVYREDGHREKDKDRSNMYLNNLRYGARLQVGIRSTDFFFNYDMNELFATGKGPKLNAFSFGVIF